MKSVLDSFLRYARSHALIARNDRILVALSGGPDSQALLKLLLIVRKRLGLTLWAAHLNHALRGSASDKDEAFVREVCRREHVPFFSKKADARAFARKRGLSLEEGARELRYAFLLGLARRLKASKLATAHTLDDQAETVLMRIIRGAGLRGLGAIPPRRSEKGTEIIRPLLGIPKQDLTDFLTRQKWRYRKDASNRDPSFLRNRIRLGLIPWVEKRCGPGFRRSLAELSSISREAYDYLAGKAEREFRRLRRRSGKRLVFSRDSLSRLHPALRREIYFRACEEITRSRRRVAKAHWESVDFLMDSALGAEVHLARRLVVRKTPKAIIFSRHRGTGTSLFSA